MHLHTYTCMYAHWCGCRERGDDASSQFPLESIAAWLSVLFHARGLGGGGRVHPPETFLSHRGWAEGMVVVTPSPYSPSSVLLLLLVVVFVGVSRCWLAGWCYALLVHPPRALLLLSPQSAPDVGPSQTCQPAPTVRPSDRRTDRRFSLYGLRRTRPAAVVVVVACRSLPLSPRPVGTVRRYSAEIGGSVAARSRWL